MKSAAFYALHCRMALVWLAKSHLRDTLRYTGDILKRTRKPKLFNY